MENLRVRRAGFAYRRLYEIFLARYKSLCPATWPKYPGPAKDGVKAIVDHLGYHPEDYRMGEYVWLWVFLLWFCGLSCFCIIFVFIICFLQLW